MTDWLLAAKGGAAAAGCPSAGRYAGEVGVDLHIHSCFSDGVKTPAELLAMAKKAGVQFLALCDHDTANGVPVMQKLLVDSGITLFPGVEVSTGESGSTHVLCYGPAVLEEEARVFLQQVAQERIGRAEEMMRRLAREGVCIPAQMQQRLLACSSVGRTHLARALIELGVVSTVKQAFERFLSQGRPAYVPRRLPSTAAAVEAFSRMGAVTVLAHPMRMDLETTALHALIASLKECGLQGIEAWHPSSARHAAQLDAMARSMNLLVTGGSDYHGDSGSTAHLGRLPSGWHNRMADLSALTRAIVLAHTPTKGVNNHV